MPLHTIGLLGVRVTHNQTGEEVHPSNFGPNQSDFFDDWNTYLDRVVADHGVTSRERFFTVEKHSSKPRRREVKCELDYGHFGSRRRVRNAANGEHVGDIETEEVPSDALRALLRAPVNGHLAFIAHEIIGRASATGIVISALKKQFASDHPGYRLAVDYVEDADAWNEFLDGASLKELTFVARRTADGNRAGRPTKELYDVVPGRRGDVLPRSWLDRLRSDGHLPAGEVLSVPVSDDDIDETRVVVEKDGRRRTILIGDDWPRFTWEVEPGSNTRPADSRFYAVARSIIDSQLAHLNIDG